MDIIEKIDSNWETPETSRAFSRICPAQLSTFATAAHIQLPTFCQESFLLKYKISYPVCPSPVDTCCIFSSNFNYFGDARSLLFPWPNAPSFPYPQVKTRPLSSRAAAKLSPASMSTILKRMRDLIRKVCLLRLHTLSY